MVAALLVALSLVSVATANVIPVTVGGINQADKTPLLIFDPPAVAANDGDTVVFTFKQKNHTVTQTSFGEVCHPLLDNTTHVPVFDSGFHPVDVSLTTGFPTVNYTVKGTDPLWFFCAQTGHCGKGMVFSINCPATGDHSLDNFKKAAAAFGAQSSWAATATPDVYANRTYTPVYHPTVTQTITLNSQTWTTAYESFPNSPNPTPVSAQGTEHRVIVGANGTLTFSPPNIAAAPRDTIVFEFHAKNHTATQSSFGNPCKKLEFSSTTGEKGFDSGFNPVNASLTTNFPTYTVTVNDTAPIWVYCRQVNHCGQGMVFSANSDEGSDRNFAAFQELAKANNGSISSNTTGQTSSNKNVAPTVRASMASVALLVVGGLFVLAL